MSKVKFGDSDSHVAELQVTAKLERAQADDSTRQLTRMMRRIDAFHEAIDYVSFSSVEEAPMWAEHWREWLQTGMFPVAAEKGDEELPVTAQPDQPPPAGNDPSDQPDPPIAATG